MSVKGTKEWEGIFEPIPSRPVMSKPPRATASKKLIREVADALHIEDDDEAREAADWIADKLERFAMRNARGVFEMDGSGPRCSACGQIWPLCGCHHFSEIDDEEDA